ncbi:L-threonylcarbamoyladenylate synthase [Epibacterium ulvae]|uniref:L-threonylcarbamoyladenylate synthase n=1 Tax=Epibacterium ulvae TaxID=1156985 RepID=UPI0024917CDC|nr:L-threonylcarbamoyladenylate synthase [Epibacterium ulvae]
MKPERTVILSPTEADLDKAAELLRAGQLVAFPTETVYGLGGNACDGNAVAGIYEAKGRPSFNPLIAHIADIKSAQKLVIWSDMAEQLSQAFWPGPLTLVLPLKPDHGVSGLVTAGLETLAVRVPAHPTARALLARVGHPVAAPSANPSGRISPTQASHVVAGLSGRIAAILDDGACGVGLESTILGLSNDIPTLLRPGGLAADEIETILGYPLKNRDTADPLTAPGQLLSHYAPNASVRLNVTAPDAGELYLGFGARQGDLNLSSTGDLAEAAANLFEHLHQLDARALPIAVAPIPYHGLGQAINDRLQRAAAPRS